MKAKLEFDLDDLSDRMAHKRAISATDVYIMLNEFDNYLRQMVKYDVVIGSGNKIKLPSEFHKITEKESAILHEVVQNIRDHLYQLLEKNKINMEDLE